MLLPSVFFPISTHFTTSLEIPFTFTILECSSFNCDFEVEPQDLTTDLVNHLQTLYALVIPDNTCILRLTATAGTELADAYS
jgi:hypothetical protein